MTFLYCKAHMVPCISLNGANQINSAMIVSLDLTNHVISILRSSNGFTCFLFCFCDVWKLLQKVQYGVCSKVTTKEVMNVLIFLHLEGVHLLQKRRIQMCHFDRHLRFVSQRWLFHQANAIFRWK
mmetsp:Transcript_35785/g.54254  ORF Transcript_35785/g.54254 Transcript_35785/m.54254 type:complete len:125 (+) Transcript_35785:1419-1793(+)